MRGRTKIAAAAILFLLAIPFPTLESPQWDVAVRDKAGLPLRGILVRESYQNYSAEFTGSEEDRYTGADGHVQFSQRRLWSSVLQRIWVMLWGAEIAHASFGPHAFVFAIDGFQSAEPVKNGVVEDWTGSPAALESVIVLNETSKPRMP